MAPVTTTSTKDSEENNSTWKLKLLYDGECPLCVKEVNFLTKKDAGQGIIKFVDISRLDYDPQANGGIDFATAMGRIHGILANGTIISNVEVFRQAYESLGMGWIYAITRMPLIGAIADWLYGIWANYRLKITGRPELNIIIAQRQKKLDSSNSSRCRVN